MPFRIASILAASDLSNSSNEVIRSAAALAALTGADLHVVHAEEEPAPDAPTTPLLEPPPSAAEELRRQVATTIPQGAEVASEQVAVGPAPTAILMRAAEVDAELIVIGAHRNRSDPDRPLGTTADLVVRSSPRPCLVVRRPVTLPLRRILVPVDFSAASAVALDVALTWGNALRMPTVSGQVTGMDVVHVLDANGDRDASPEAVREKVEAQIAGAIQRAGTRARLEIQPHALSADDAVEAILNFALENQADLLVMATHGGKRAEKFGSVSSAVAQRSACPVLLVPPVLWWTRRAQEAALEAL